MCSSSVCVLCMMMCEKMMMMMCEVGEAENVNELPAKRK